MPLRLDIKRRLTSCSDRVKCVDLHPTVPWMLCALYNGHEHVMNYENNRCIKISRCENGLAVAAKDMGACEIHPQTIALNPNGCFVVVCGDVVYAISLSKKVKTCCFHVAFKRLVVTRNIFCNNFVSKIIPKKLTKVVNLKLTASEIKLDLMTKKLTAMTNFDLAKIKS